jgi:N-acetylmuramoyl-L-alanine amidase
LQDQFPQPGSTILEEEIAVMPSLHEVVQGEHLAMIAAQYGFTDYSIIWNDGNNAQLKAQRINPNVLLPGDVVFIPDKQQGSQQGATSARHTFQLNQNKLSLRLILEDIYEKPVANAPGVLIVDDQRFQVTTDGTGKIVQEIPLNAQNCTLMLKTDQTPFGGEALTIKIGHLDPVDCLSGQQARLNNLGYSAGNSNNPKDPQFLAAVQEFQCDQGLDVDGDIGPATQAKLKSFHGC